MALAAQAAALAAASLVLRAGLGAEREGAVGSALDHAALWRAVVIASVVGALVTVLATMIAARSVSRGIERVTGAAADFAKGRREARAPEHWAPELSRLAKTLNETGEAMRGQILELNAQNRQQEAILQSMDGGVIALDRAQRVLRVNLAAERMLGIEGARVRGRLLQEVVREPELNQFVGAAMADPVIQSGEFELRGERPASVRAACGALRSSEGRPVGLLVVLNDVTQLRRLETMRTDFAANVSHELRTPITNIKGYVETLLETDPADREQAERFLAVISKNAERLGAIVEDMLTLTRLERPESHDELAVAPTPVVRVIENVATQLSAEARGKEISVEADAPSELFARVNEALVEQALANLVANAIRYSPARTQVVVRAQRLEEEGQRSMVEISVTDEGPGIAPEHLERIFERFYRIDRARSREQGGTGLGLAIAKHIALVHAGRVEAESTLGRGSTFRLILPAE